MHALLTLFTLGLWAVSWISITLGVRMRPWRCRHCNCSEPDFDYALPDAPGVPRWPTGRPPHRGSRREPPTNHGIAAITLLFALADTLTEALTALIV